MHWNAAFNRPLNVCLLTHWTKSISDKKLICCVVNTFVTTSMEYFLLGCIARIFLFVFWLRFDVVAKMTENYLTLSHKFHNHTYWIYKFQSTFFGKTMLSLTFFYAHSLFYIFILKCDEMCLLSILSRA